MYGKMFTNKGWASKFEELMYRIQTIYKAFISALSAPVAETGERIQHKSKIFPDFTFISNLKQEPKRPGVH